MSDPENLFLSEESVARALVCQCEGVGDKIFWRLLDEAGSCSEIFKSPGLVSDLEVKGLSRSSIEDLRENLESWDLAEAGDRLREKKIGLLSSADGEYPELLEEIYSPPPVLFYRGNPEILGSSAVAVVGTRSCSEHGRQIAGNIASGLAEVGVTVVSGLAAGIDAAGHRGALENGKTVAVLGSGVDRPYPARNRDLHEELSRSQLVVSEYPPGTDPHPTHFPARNRIISGLSLGVLVVQAGERSGALITADFALEQGREVYAVPGAVGDENHRGCHMLVKQGAGLVEEAEDIIDSLQFDGHFFPEQKRREISPAASEVLSQLSFRPVHIDEIVVESGRELGECSRLLLELEKNDLVMSLPGQRYQKSPDFRHLEVSTSDPAEEK